ncbi:MAG: EAL domain-containing protein [Rhodoferax sp.]|nr:EAL domain-containing protein [Rhodoferax sp.]
MFKHGDPPSVKTTSHPPRTGWPLHALVRRAYLKHSLGKRLAMLMVLAAAVSALLAGMGILGLKTSNESLHEVYEHRMVPVRELSRIQQLMMSNRLILQVALSAVHVETGPAQAARLALNADAAQASADAIARNIELISARWAAYASRSLTPQEADQAANFASQRARYIEQALRPAIVALRANNYAAVQRSANDAGQFFEDMAPQLEALSLLQFNLAQAAYQTGTERYQRTRWLSLAALLGSMLMMTWLGVILIRSIVRPLQRVIDTFRQISMGRYDTLIRIEGADEVSEVMHALQAMQSKLGDDEAAIHKLAFYDPLTQLPNRRLLRDRLQLALNASARNQLYGAVLMIDLDNFKTINDGKGHDVGDDLLVQTARRIQSCLRQTDTVARLGGDEFVVMLESLCNDAGLAAVLAEGIGEKILHTIRQPCVLADQPHEHTASIGICLFPDFGTTIDDLLKHADLAMYQAKATGRDTQRFFDPQIQTALEARLILEVELRQALPQHQLELFYQVQVDNTQHVLGAEVLLRWRHPTRGMVGPAEFIAIAEESGLIVPIGEWVLRSACEQLRHWQGSPGTAGLLLSVNVSARQFRQADFASLVRRISEETGIDTSRLKLELTESLVLHNVDDTVTKMKALNQLGIEFSMDDFGTGYSSLSQLNKLPIAQLKIDRSFVSHITQNRSDAVIVQTIIGMANNLGVTVIAEGVETEEQRAVLERLGCLSYQGYLAGKPMPLREFETVVMQAISADASTRESSQ